MSTNLSLRRVRSVWNRKLRKILADQEQDPQRSRWQEGQEGLPGRGVAKGERKELGENTVTTRCPARFPRTAEGAGAGNYFVSLREEMPERRKQQQLGA